MPPVVTVLDTPSGAAEMPCLTPWLLCEGTCAGYTPHVFVKATLKFWASGYEQIYECRQCKTPRVWGRTSIP